MAAHGSSVGRSWVSALSNDNGVIGGEAGGVDRRELRVGFPPIDLQTPDTGSNASHNSPRITVACLPCEDEFIDTVQLRVEDDKTHKLTLESAEISRVCFSTSSPPRSPCALGSAASCSLSCGESSTINEVEGCDGLPSDFDPLGGPFSLQGTEMEVGCEAIAARLSVSRLKQKLDDVAETFALQGSTIQFRDFLQGESNIEALFGSGSLFPSPPSSMEGLPVRGANEGLDASLLHAETPEMLQAIRAGNMRIGAEFAGDHGPFGDSQQGPVSVHPRTDLFRLRFPEKTPDKLYRKRAKTYPPSYTLRQQRNIRASGPLGGNSAIMSLGAPLELDSQGLPPSLPPTDAPSGQGDEDPMDSDLVGGDEDDGGRQHNLVDAEDGEARMDLTDDLLHKVFSFLKDVDLCQAAKVCRQWRVASAQDRKSVV